MNDQPQITADQLRKILTITQYGSCAIFLVLAFVFYQPGFLVPAEDPSRPILPLLLATIGIIEFFAFKFFIIPLLIKNRITADNDPNKGHPY